MRHEPGPEPEWMRELREIEQLIDRNVYLYLRAVRFNALVTPLLNGLAVGAIVFLVMLWMRS